MKIRIIDAVLTCILCFLTGMAVMLWYTQLTEKPQEPPVVNVYVIASDKEEEVKIGSDENTEIIIEEPKIKKKWYSEEDVINMAKMCYGESMNLPVLHTDFGDRSSTYQSAEAMWAVLNRVDAGYGDISTCIKAKRQFVGYKSDNPITDELYDLAKLVIEDWATGTEEYRVLPHIFRYFYGDGRHNHFTTKSNGGGVEYNHLIPDPFA
nr:MAG TPA: hypothetical protein [Caudoviricetes sp.]